MWLWLGRNVGRSTTRTGSLITRIHSPTNNQNALGIGCAGHRRRARFHGFALEWRRRSKQATTVSQCHQEYEHGRRQSLAVLPFVIGRRAPIFECANMQNKPRQTLVLVEKKPEYSEFEFKFAAITEQKQRSTLQADHSMKFALEWFLQWV